MIGLQREASPIQRERKIPSSCKRNFFVLNKMKLIPHQKDSGLVSAVRN